MGIEFPIRSELALLLRSVEGVVELFRARREQRWRIRDRTDPMLDLDAARRACRKLDSSYELYQIGKDEVDGPVRKWNPS